MTSKFACLILFSVFTFFHEYHVSITEIHFNEETNQVEISIKLFIDDFEKAMNISGNNIRVKDDLSEAKVRQSIEDYLDNHFTLHVNGNPLVLKYLGAEWDEDLHSFFVLLESPSPEDIQRLEIFNNVFVEVSDQQENIHHLDINGLQKTILLNVYKTAEVLEIDH
ncbi:MAG: hypothetical protein RIE58_10470 [Vicingaceae bacterium]